MPLRRVAAAAVLALVVTAGATGCSDDEPGAGTTRSPATATPTALGDRPLVEVVGAGGGEQRTLRLEPAAGTSNDASLVVSQEIARGQQATRVPPITVPFAVAVTEAGPDELRSTQTYAEPTVDATGLRPADVAGVRRALSTLAGTTSTLVVRRDGTTVTAASGDGAAAPFDTQVRALVPVLPAAEVGVGASWTATRVSQVDGATVDEVATYTLEALEGDAYVIGVAIDQVYRPGPVKGVEVDSGRGTVTARLEGSLARLLPDAATGTVSTQVSYLIDGRVTEVRTTVSLALATT